ncbi:MAG: PEP-CTERM sorting domain-containing protein [Phycisphaerales bacterium]|nr:PEP-CTERM sorting domain-containing protein [Phycisphaerales bacterium]
MLTRLAAGAVVVVIGSGCAHAQVVSLFGDLGPGGVTGTPISAINSTFTQSFTQTAAAGSIAFDVIVSNDPTGTIFDLTITNLNYTCTAPNTSGFGDVSVIVTHTYQASGSGTYLGSHALSGSWTSGALSTVQLNSIQDFGVTNTPLTPLLATSSPFSLGPATQTVVTGNSAVVYQIQAILRLRTDGLGSIVLPSSAHIRGQLVPAPSAAAVLGLGVLGVARRRRRG